MIWFNEWADGHEPHQSMGIIEMLLKHMNTP